MNPILAALAVAAAERIGLAALHFLLVLAILGVLVWLAVLPWRLSRR